MSHPTNPMSSVQLAARYLAFAVIATLCNLLAQESVYQGYQGPYVFAAALVIGTGVGLVVKYLLDKRYIFRFQTRNKAHDSRTFMLYTLMGLTTTIIFWGAETLALLIFGNKTAQYSGAVIGLAIGYVVKYQLDKRFVFSHETNP